MTKGLTKLYPWGASKRSITSLLGERRIFNFVPGNTYGSKREAIRKMLATGKITYDVISKLPDTGATTEADLYGSQRRRADLPLKRTTGETIHGPRLTHNERYDGPYDPNEPPKVFRNYGGFNRGRTLRNTRGQEVEGPRLPPRRRPKQPASRALVVNGKRLGAKKALEMHPMLRQHVMQKGKQGVREATLANRLRKMNREEGIPSHLVDVREARITQDMNHRIRSNIVSHHNLENPDRNLSVLEFLDGVRGTVMGFIREKVPSKIQIILKSQFQEKDDSSPIRYFRSTQHVALESTNVDELYEEIAKQLVYAFEVHTGRDSGLLLKYVLGLSITVSKFDPVRITGSGYIPLPDRVVNSLGVINMENKDDKCFMYAVTRFLNPVEKNAKRITKQLLEQTKKLDWRGVSFPTPLDGGSISSFESNNNVGVFVVGLQTNKFVPLRAPGKGYEKIVDLFFYRNEHGESHYACVKSLSRLLRSGRTKGNHKFYYCRYCLKSFYKEDKQIDHTYLCSQHKCTKVDIPPKGSTLKFGHYRNTIRAPLVAYADFETMHKGVSEKRGKTRLEAEHILICFSVVFVSDIPNFQPKPVTYTGLDAGKKNVFGICFTQGFTNP